MSAVHPTLIVFLLFLAALVRIPYVYFWDVFYNADYALMNLVGLHAMRGEFSFYLWGQNYHAAVEPLLMAPLFKLFSPTPLVASVIPAIFCLVFLALYHRYLRRVCDAWTATVATLILCVPAPFFMSIASRNGNYIEILCLGMLHLLLFQKLLDGERTKPLLFSLGLAAGFSWFYLRIILIFWLAMALHWLLRSLAPGRFEGARRFLRDLTPGTFWNEIILLKRFDVHPWLRVPLIALNFYNLGNFILSVALWFHGPYIRMVGGTKLSLDFWPLLESSIKMAVVVALLIHWRALRDRAAALIKSPIQRMLPIGFLVGYSPAILGMFWGEFPDSRNGIANASELFRNFKLVAASLVPALAGEGSITALDNFAAAFAGLALLYFFWRIIAAFRAILLKGETPPDHFPILCLGAVTFMLGITYDRLIDPSTLRYFFPLFLCLPLGIAWIAKAAGSISRWLAYALIALYLANSVDANVQALKRHENPVPQQVLSDHLAQRGIRGGYANYWIAYYVTFISRENLVIVSTEDQDRYQPHLDFVRSLDKAVFLGEPTPAPASEMSIKGVSYRVTSVEDIAGTSVAYLEKAF